MSRLRRVLPAPCWLGWETVLHEHSKNVRNAWRAYQRFVEQGIDDPPPSPWKAAVGGSVLGTSAWVEGIRERLAEEPADGNVPQRRQFAWRPSAVEFFRVVRVHFVTASSEFSKARRHGNDARTAAVYLIRRLTDEKATALAKQLAKVFGQ